MKLFEPETVAGHLAYQSPDYDKENMDFINVNSKVQVGGMLLDGINRITGSSTIAAKYPSLK
jgi:hypothetical protein